MSENPGNTKSHHSRKWWIVGLAIALILGLLVGLWLGSPSGTTPIQDTQVSVEKEQKPTVWTCSMHPQIRLPKPGLCPICNMDLIPLDNEDSDDMLGMRQLAVSKNALKLMDVETIPVSRRYVTATIRMVGKVDFDETRLAYITSWVPGRLDRLFVDYTGVPVSKGDHLINLYSPELYSTQEELLQAIKTARAVKDSQLESSRLFAEQTIKSAREKLILWGLKAEQIDEIEKRGSASDHITIYAPVGGIVIHKNALEGQYVQTGTQIYTIADLTRVWVKLDAYESDLQWLRYGQKVEFTALSYPGETFTGTISFIDPILNEKTRSVKIRVNVPNIEGKLKPEMFIKAIVHSEVAAGGKVLNADLAGKWISPMHPEIIKDEPGFCDVCGMPLVRTESLGYVTAEPKQTEKPLVIPVSAALVTGTRAIVYVKVSEEDKVVFEGREIVLGPRAGDYYLVRSGLAEGEEVVTKGNFKIDSALQILAKPSMMTPDGGGGGGGHHHGGTEPKVKSDEATEVMDSSLSAIGRYQLQEVLQSGQNIQLVYKEDGLTQVQQAALELEKKIDAVDMQELSGHTHMQWMELSMRLKNDAIELQEAQTNEEAQRVVTLLANNMQALQTKLGLREDPGHPMRETINPVFRENLDGVYQAYFSLQQALADDQADLAIQSAAEILRALKGIDAQVLPEQNQASWKKVLDDLSKVLASIKATEDIESLRKTFHLISQQLIQVSQDYGSPGNEPIYIFHCPMAFDNSGADWLQPEDQTLNPYFGHMMLRCGGVKEVVPVMSIWKTK